MPTSAVRNTPLPPSVEKAYQKKCVELKRRLLEIEEANDDARLRKRRVDRAIMKMRLERAFLLDRLAKSQHLNADDSDKSTSPPPTPQERAPRQRRAYRSPPPPDAHHHGYPSPPGPYPQGVTASSSRLLPVQSAIPSTYSPQQPYMQHEYPQEYPPRPVPSMPYEKIDRRAPSEIDAREPLPSIYSLPFGTNVLILNGHAKPTPWTIRDIEPRHHLIPGFDNWPYDAQAQKIKDYGYCPYDIHGNPVVLGWSDEDQKYKQLFKDDTEWEDPVRDQVRRDDPWRERPQNLYTKEGEPVLVRHPSHHSSKMSNEDGRRNSDGVGPDDPSPSTGSTAGNVGGGFTAVNR